MLRLIPRPELRRMSKDKFLAMIGRNRISRTPILDSMKKMVRAKGPSKVFRGDILSPDRRWMLHNNVWIPKIAGGEAFDTTYPEEVRFEFEGDLIPARLATTSDSGTITVNVGLSGGGAGRNSILRLDNSAGGDNEMAEVDFGALYYQAQDDYIGLEARVLLERIIVAATVGFNDETTESSDTLPVELSGTTFTSNAGTFVGFVIDSNATNDNWHVFWVDDDNDGGVTIATLNTGVALAADKWYTLKVEVWDGGSGNLSPAQFHVSDGTTHFQYRNDNTIDRDQAMVPHLAVENRTGTGAFMDIDYIRAWKSRQDTAP